jgi:hypothetical protein
MGAGVRKWVMDVLEPGAPVTQTRRFTYDTKPEAWAAYVRAMDNGFITAVEEVEDGRAEPAVVGPVAES